jgi:HPt (histidine-containing phosphotransfer) domain-containing protein
MLDLNAMTSNCGGDSALLSELAQAFLEEYPNYLAALDQAVSNGSSDEVRFAAHRLRGSLSIFDAHAALNAAAHLENLGLRQQLTEVPMALTVLKGELSLVENEIRALVSEH